jgi:tetratricopeptide (TPR) repeat protein
MDAISEQPEKAEKNAPPAEFGQGLAEFIQRNRKTLGMLAAALLIAAAASAAAFGIREALRSRALRDVENLSRRRGDLGGDLKNAPEPELAGLLGDLENFAAKHSGYAGARARSLLAEIHGGREDWAAAEENWKAAAKAGAGTYLEPAALFNAAAAAEQGGKAGEALELYLGSLAHAEKFPAAPRAQFSVGRLREAQGDRGGALEAYRELLDRWPLDPVWPNLAQSRIIALELSGAAAPR